MSEGDKYYGKMKSIAGKGRASQAGETSSTLGPKVRAYLVCLRNYKLVSVAGAERSR